MEDQQFIKGFNNGYFLAEHQPGLLNTLLKGINSGDSSFLEGLKEGQKQHENELQREQIKNSINRSNTQGKSNDKNLNR